MPEPLISFFILLSAAMVFSELFRRLHLPYVNALILSGIVLGPYALNIIEVNPTVVFIGSIGIVFLMFIAGTEIRIESFQKMRKDIFVLTILNGLIPFLIGFSICNFFGQNFYSSLIVGVAFISSSIAVIIPSLESNGLIKKRVGKAIVGSTVFEDIGSLIILAFILQTFTQKSPLPLPVYIPVVLVLIVLMKTIIPKIEKEYYHKKVGKDLFERELRFIFTVLIASVVLFEALGMHALIAGFVIGIILSDSIKGKIEEKIRTISYGFFIPVFFVILGLQTDLSVFSSMTSIWFIFSLVTGLIGSKILSGWVGGRILKFTNKESLLIGVSTIPQLSTTLAAAYAALEFGILNQEIITALVVISVVTTFLAPELIRLLLSTKHFSVRKLK